jgi:periplasmic divalent cation tolerance protein
MSSRTVIVLTSVDSLRRARQLARAMVQRRLTACVHVAPIESFYHWEGRLQQAREFQLAMKTTAARAGELQSVLRTLHPYALPAIYVVVPSQVHAPYARWVEQRCAVPPVSRATRGGSRSRSGTKSGTGRRA